MKFFNCGKYEHRSADCWKPIKEMEKAGLSLVKETDVPGLCMIKEEDSKQVEEKNKVSFTDDVNFKIYMQPYCLQLKK